MNFHCNPDSATHLGCLCWVPDSVVMVTAVSGSGSLTKGKPKPRAHFTGLRFAGVEARPGRTFLKVEL